MFTQILSTIIVLIHAIRSRSCITSSWGWDNNHVGKRPNCTVANIDGHEGGYMWGYIDDCKSQCQSHPTCNIVVRFGPIRINDDELHHCYAHSCPDLDNIVWITENRWGLGSDTCTQWTLTECITRSPTPTPTTPIPTTNTPTTTRPTTLYPTTTTPTTKMPTTAAPTTYPPTTYDPTSAAPTTESPTTMNPTTVPPISALSTIPEQSIVINGANTITKFEYGLIIIVTFDSQLSTNTISGVQSVFTHYITNVTIVIATPDCETSANVSSQLGLQNNTILQAIIITCNQNTQQMLIDQYDAVVLESLISDLHGIPSDAFYVDIQAMPAAAKRVDSEELQVPEVSEVIEPVESTEINATNISDNFTPYIIFGIVISSICVLLVIVSFCLLLCIKCRQRENKRRPTNMTNVSAINGELKVAQNPRPLKIAHIHNLLPPKQTLQIVPSNSSKNRMYNGINTVSIDLDIDRKLDEIYCKPVPSNMPFAMVPKPMKYNSFDGSLQNRLPVQGQKLRAFTMPNNVGFAIAENDGKQLPVSTVTPGGDPEFSSTTDSDQENPPTTVGDTLQFTHRGSTKL